MVIQPIKTRRLTPPKDDFSDILDSLIPRLKAGMIVAITSKIVSIHEGNCIPVEQVKDKDQLIINESEKYLSRDLVPGGWVMHTIKKNLLIPTSGIDESNANSHCILWPKNPDKSAQDIWRYLVKGSGLNKLGVIITDSHSIPMRRGLVGISLAFFGFKPLLDYRHQQDLFGRELKVSQTNIPDSLATGAVFTMGEGCEQTPIALISGLPEQIEFTAKKLPTENGLFNSLSVSLEEDLYAPFLTSVPWKKGGSS